MHSLYTEVFKNRHLNKTGSELGRSKPRISQLRDYRRGRCCFSRCPRPRKNPNTVTYRIHSGGNSGRFMQQSMGWSCFRFFVFFFFVFFFFWKKTKQKNEVTVLQPQPLIAGSGILQPGAPWPWDRALAQEAAV